jgi:hypothetical protein
VLPDLGEIAAHLQCPERHLGLGVWFDEVAAGIVDNIPVGVMDFDVLRQQVLREVLVELVAQLAIGVLLDIAAGSVHDLPSMRRQSAVGAGLQIGLLHDCECGLADADGSPACHRVAPVHRGGGIAFLALALLRPLLGDAVDRADDLVRFHERTTTADLPRSVYSTRGQAMCSTRITGSSRSARC